MKLELWPRCVGKSRAAKTLKEEAERCGFVVPDISIHEPANQNKIWIDDLKAIDTHIFANEPKESHND